MGGGGESGELQLEEEEEGEEKGREGNLAFLSEFIDIVEGNSQPKIYWQ